MSGVEGAAGGTPRYSSSPELSTPPRSPSEPGSPAARQLFSEHRDAQDAVTVHQYGVEVPAPPPEKIRKKPGRKPKNQNLDGSSTATDVKAKRPRKPREPRDPNLPPIQRRKRATPTDVDSVAKIASAASRQLKINEVNNIQPNHGPAYGIPADPAQYAQPGNYEDIQRPVNTFFQQPPPQPQQQLPPQPQPLIPHRTSGQNYDPIRSNFDNARDHAPNPNSFNSSQLSPKPTQLVNRASASPSISSLVDPPYQSATSPSMAQQSFFSHQMKLQNQDRPTSVPPSPTHNRIAPSPPINTIPSQSNIRPRVPEKPIEQQYSRAPVPTPNFSVAPAPVPAAAKTNTSSAAPSPKPPKLIDVTPPPLPGQALTKNGMFENTSKDGDETRAPTIVLHIPIKGASNHYINFTKLAEERYGWDALHPRLAAQRDRLARVAAAGAALEKNGGHKESGDDMSLDVSDGEGSNVEMGGMSDGRTGTDGASKKVVKKRKMKEDDYDKEDGFVDDTDLLWEEQAAASVDGFFVYSGPLVPEGEKPSLERSDGTIKRGRGSGRGRGGRPPGPGRGGATAGGPGSRGGATTRKPRITKADRARRDQEKAEREKMGALAARPASYVLASGPAMGGTPLVFNQ